MPLSNQTDITLYYEYFASLVIYSIYIPISIKCILIVCLFILHALTISPDEPRCLEVPGTYNPSSSHPNVEAPESDFLNVFIQI